MPKVRRKRCAACGRLTQGNGAGASKAAKFVHNAKHLLDKAERAGVHNFITNSPQYVLKGVSNGLQERKLAPKRPH